MLKRASSGSSARKSHRPAAYCASHVCAVCNRPSERRPRSLSRCSHSTARSSSARPPPPEVLTRPGPCLTTLRVMSTLPILCYHNIGTAPSGAAFRLLYVSAEMFDRQLWTLRRLGLRGVSTGEGLRHLANGTSRGSVVLTFDDGYADTLTTAVPIMKQHGFRATCYIVSGAVGTHNRWDADYLGETKPLMSRGQLDQWLAAGMEVGSHSLSHRRLCGVAQDVLREEIAGSRAAL